MQYIALTHLLRKYRIRSLDVPSLRECFEELQVFLRVLTQKSSEKSWFSSQKKSNLDKPGHSEFPDTDTLIKCPSFRRTPLLRTWRATRTSVGGWRCWRPGWPGGTATSGTPGCSTRWCRPPTRTSRGCSRKRWALARDLIDWNINLHLRLANSLNDCSE